MRKTAVDAGIAGVILGAGLGLLPIDGKIAPFNAAIGGILGGSVGTYAEIIGSWLRSQRLKKNIKDFPNATPAEIKRLGRDARRLKIPVYLQSGGTPIENAFYSEEGAPNMLLGDKPVWKDAFTGKKVDSPELRGVFVGSDFKKLPVLYHELGHAEDLGGKSKFSKIAPQVALIAAGVGGMMTSYIASKAYVRTNDPSALTTSMIGAGVSTGAWIAKRLLTRSMERAASRNALKAMSQVQKPKQLEQSRALLTDAYKTYEPYSFGPEPDFA